MTAPTAAVGYRRQHGLAALLAVRLLVLRMQVTLQLSCPAISPWLLRFKETAVLLLHMPLLQVPLRFDTG
jgi:hypothetical protein